MRFEDYVAARRGRLVEHAVDLGCDPDVAPGLVDAVLEQQRRRIERAADPDLTTYDAVARALTPPRARPSPRLVASLVALLVAVVALPLAAWVVLRPGPTVAVPSFFGRDASAAGDALRTAGLVADRAPVRVCEPAGLVLGSEPGAGSRVETGSTVRLRVSGAPGRSCPDQRDRTAAWAFLGFVRGGPPPAFDDTVYVVLDGREPAVLPRAAVLDPERWAGIRAVARDLDALTGGAGSYPLLLAGTATPPAEQCGTPRPAAAGDREALRLTVLARGGGREPCPLRVDLYRDSAGTIDAVVVYSAGG